MFTTVKKAAERLYEVAVRADGKSEEYKKLGFSTQTSLSDVEFASHRGHLVAQFGKTGRMSMPLEPIKNPQRRQEMRDRFRAMLSDLRNMNEHVIVDNGQVQRDVLDKLVIDAPYLLSDGQIQRPIYFNGLARGANGEGPRMWFRVKQGFIYTDHWLDLGKAQEGLTISLFTLPNFPSLRKR